MRAFIILAMMVSVSRSEGAEVFRCQIKTKAYVAEFSLSPRKEGKVIWEDPSGKTGDACTLDLISVTDRQKGIVPSFRMDFASRACKSEVLKKVSLNLRYPRQNKQAQLQWRNDRQPDECIASRLNLTALEKLARP